MDRLDSQDNNDLFSDMDEQSSFSEKYFGLSTTKATVALTLVICGGLYISLLLFGNNSLNVLFDLEEYESYLSSEVARLKSENAKLQKEYFELLELDSQ